MVEGVSDVSDIPGQLILFIALVCSKIMSKAHVSSRKTLEKAILTLML